MKNFKLIIGLGFLIVYLTGCSLIGNVFTYSTKTENFVNALLHQDYDKGISLLDAQTTNGQNNDTLKARLAHIRNIIVENFGDKLDYSLETATKTFSTENAESTPADQTLVLIQISNGKQFGELKLFFNDKSQKISSFSVQNTKEQIPNMLYFWLFAIVVLAVLAFNIYVIVLIKRSNIKRKWLKYLAIIFLNLPTIGYRAIGGLFFSLGIQLMLGISFAYTGYINYVMATGIPLGGLFVFYRLKKGLYKTTDIKPEEKIGEDNERPEPENEQNKTIL